MMLAETGRGRNSRPRYAHEIRVSQKPEFGLCSCGGKIMHHDDGGVRCVECRNLYGINVSDFRKKASNLRPPEHIESPKRLA